MVQALKDAKVNLKCSENYLTGDFRSYEPRFLTNLLAAITHKKYFSIKSPNPTELHSKNNFTSLKIHSIFQSRISERFTTVLYFKIAYLSG